MLCSVADIALYVGFKVILVQVLHSAEIVIVGAALPPGAEDEIVLIEHLPGRRVHLQDFFWTGAEDAPSWLDPDQTLTFYETRTIHHTATVFVPGEGIVPGPSENIPSVAPQDPGCTNCIEPTPTLVDPDQDIGILVGDDPGPRYWLLTVLRSGESVPPKVELRLARLYRAAFARQQQRHLGLLSTDPRLRRATKRRLITENTKSILKSPNDSAQKSTGIDSLSLVTEASSSLQPKKEGVRMREFKISKDYKFLIDNTDIDQTTASSVLAENNDGSSSFRVEGQPSLSSAGITKIKEFSDSITSTSPGNIEATESREEYSPSSEEYSSTTRIAGIPQYLMGGNSQFYPDMRDVDNLEPTINDDKVSSSEGDNDEAVRLKKSNEAEENGTEVVREPQSAKLNSTNSRLRTSGMVQVRMQNTTVLEDGSTRLIYSVHLGGKPVPAETAAKDMALLSPQEVALELGAPVIIQSEPYLKESRPLALSRRRDAWLLVGAASVALILLLVLAGIILALKRKKAHSAVSAPPTQSILKKERGGYTPTTPGLDNTGYTSETEGRTEGTSQRQTPGSISRSPATPITPDTLDEEIHELSSDNNDEKDEGDVKKQGHEHWDIEEYPLSGKKSRAGRRRMTRTNAIETTGSPDSLDTVIDHQQHRDSLENGCTHVLEETASPHSYLSMPSCKLFPSMRSVEPLSRILEPVVVRHLDMEFETPEMSRRGNGFSHRDSGDELLGRTRSALKDPGVVGPIVWDLRRQRAVEDITVCRKLDIGDGRRASSAFVRTSRSSKEKTPRAPRGFVQPLQHERGQAKRHSTSVFYIASEFGGDNTRSCYDAFGIEREIRPRQSRRKSHRQRKKSSTHLSTPKRGRDNSRNRKYGTTSERCVGFETDERGPIPPSKFTRGRRNKSTRRSPISTRGSSSSSDRRY
ncbi:uncharacterized protein LOC107041671 isoform X2 [Diachasma alloeum]|uniref:uncharacterized protein LOC107041671 isoform X2 n=1 Tax=Diachasma alloeum TaxID=454923 RepID=UPI00073810E8|nr:uncharacterized protein LOC107041671 isoform X2 [Diachasma alloeum]